MALSHEAECAAEETISVLKSTCNRRHLSSRTKVTKFSPASSAACTTCSCTRPSDPRHICLGMERGQRHGENVMCLRVFSIGMVHRCLLDPELRVPVVVHHAV